MRCRQCGTEIADKALICYRCGTATTEAKFKPVAPSSGRSSRIWIVVLIVALLIAAAAAYFVWGRGVSPRTSHLIDSISHDPSRLDVCRARIDLRLVRS